MVGNALELDQLKRFLLSVASGRMEMVPADDPMAASVGYVAFVSKQVDRVPVDVELYFSVRFAAKPEVVPVRLDERAGSSLFHGEFETMLLECVTSPGWVRADDAKAQKLGFAKYGPERSVIRFFGLWDLKRCPTELIAVVNRWREDHSEAEYRKLAATMLGVAECP